MNPAPLDTLSTTSWVGAFPWLDLTPQERETVDGFSDGELDRFAISVARLAIDHETDTPLGHLFPMLPPAFELGLLDWPARHRNVLRRHQLVTAADLGTITIADLLATRSVSTLITQAILARLVRTAMTHITNQDLKL